MPGHRIVRQATLKPAPSLRRAKAGNYDGFKALFKLDRYFVSQVLASGKAVFCLSLIILPCSGRINCFLLQFRPFALHNSFPEDIKLASTPPKFFHAIKDHQ
ncbi:hypothetical protein DXT63_01295 [Thermoanaerobacteraceae bacterium SP2]|nr:hypothetical protein DXT63_01295 [Thermoanaerobacteraceae bacterium SP2]